MSPNGRKRRTTRRSVKKTSSKKRTARVRQPPELGPNYTRLVQAEVLEEDAFERLGADALRKIEELAPGQVDTLIDVANHVGREPRCWLI